MTKISAGVNTP